MIEASPYASAGYHVLKFEPHLHTLHSDGRDSVRDMFLACQSAGYDAVALTDHNTASGLVEADAMADELGLILVPGVEVTTFRGHAVALGVTSVPEWRDLAARGMDTLAAEVHAAGGVLSVAHPGALGSPACSGCAWDWPIESSSVDLWEVFSAPRPQTAVSAALWRQLLERGGRAAPVAAGDVHSREAAATERAATFLFARERARDGVFDALRCRRLSCGRAPLEVWLRHADGRVALAGEQVSGNGWTCHASAGAAIVERQGWVYAERRDAQGALEAISAPIWIDTSH